MELKYSLLIYCHNCMICSNCTFMELKLHEDNKTMVEVSGSNCTFMELKYVSQSLGSDAALAF